MQKVVISIFKTIAFLLILALCLLTINRFLIAGGADYDRNRLFFEQTNDTVDVLLAGSSHIHANINTGSLWDDYGIAAYDISAGSQPIWVTYYRIKNALQYQKPSLIVLDVYKVIDKYDIREQNGEEYLEAGAIIWNHLGLPLNAEKVQSLIESTPTDELLDYLFEYSLYHANYATINENIEKIIKEDERDRSLKGSLINFGNYTEVYPVIDMTNYNEVSDLTPKSEEYLRKIIELAQAEGIPLVLVNAPYLRVNEEAQQGFNRVGQIAAEYNISFLDYNKLINELDLVNGGEQTDYNDTGHLNYRGSRKYTSHLGNYLKTHFPLTDRRGDSAYDSWQINADYIRDRIDDFEAGKY